MLTYLLDLSEDPEEVQPGQLLEVLQRPHARGEQRGEQLGVLGHVLEALGGAGREKEREVSGYGVIRACGCLQPESDLQK